MFWRLLFILSASLPLSPTLFPILSQCMCLSWLSFFREMPVYSFVNMTNIMSFLIHHKAQIKTLFWVYTVKIHFLPPSVLILSVFFIFFSQIFFFSFSFFVFLVQLCEEIITSPNTLDHLAQLILSSIHTHRQPHIVIDGKFLMNYFSFFSFFLCLWFISKDICHPWHIELCEWNTPEYVRVARFCLKGKRFFVVVFFCFFCYLCRNESMFQKSF